MNNSVKSFKNINLSIVSAALMGCFTLIGLQGCGGSSGGGTPEAFITRINVNGAGIETSSGRSEKPVITSDGRFVVFESLSSNLVANDTNNVTDVFMRDTSTNTITRISVNSNGDEGDGESIEATVTPDGKFVAFRSSATNLVPNDGNGFADIFLYDVVNKTHERISISTGVDGVDALESDLNSSSSSISSDGRYVVFHTASSTLVSNDTNATTDVFLRDTLNNTTTRVSIASGVNGVGGDLASRLPVISADGLFVAFQSTTTNLVAGDTNASSDVFLRDLTLNTTQRISLSTGVNGDEGNADSLGVSISANGKFIAFVSDANNLVADDNNGIRDNFIRDITNNTTTRISVSSAGVESDGFASGSKVSADGRYVVFQNSGTTLVLNDINGQDDIFLRDTVNNETILLSVDSDGVQSDSDSRRPAISADNRYVVFESDASNLVADDLNAERDIFRVLISALPK